MAEGSRDVLCWPGEYSWGTDRIWVTVGGL